MVSESVKDALKFAHWLDDAFVSPHRQKFPSPSNGGAIYLLSINAFGSGSYSPSSFFLSSSSSISTGSRRRGKCEHHHNRFESVTLWLGSQRNKQSLGEREGEFIHYRTQKKKKKNSVANRMLDFKWLQSFYFLFFQMNNKTLFQLKWINWNKRRRRRW